MGYGATRVPGIKFVFLILASIDLTAMSAAVFANMDASLLVIFKGLRLLKANPFTLPK